MELKFYGANCIKITTKKASIVIDDTLESAGKKSIVTDKDIVLSTNKVLKYADGGYFKVDSPGEYEVSEISIKGIPSKMHLDPEKPSTMYSLHINGLSLAIVGHSEGKLSEKQLEEFGVVDILIVPVGGGGYTLDTVEALKLIKELEPKIIIPTHYQSDNIAYEVPQATLDEFKKATGSSEVEAEDSLKIKDLSLPEKSRVVVLSEI